MSSQNEWTQVRNTLKKLTLSISNGDLAYSDILQPLHRVESQCQQILLADLRFSAQCDLGQTLWDLHDESRKSFQKSLDLEGEKRRCVERRKIERQFIDFIKSSQRFYRSLIANLSSQFKGIPALQSLSKDWAVTRQGLAANNSKQSNLDLLVLEVCYDSLIRLGDLSRWREKVFAKRKCNWAPALGYYSLAGNVWPEDGLHHQQRAIIAAAKSDIFQSIFELYRSLCSARPPVYSRANLQQQLRNVTEGLKGTDQGAETQENTIDQNLLKEVAGSMLNILACCVLEVKPPDDGVEAKYFVNLALAFERGSVESHVSDMVLLTLAAEYESNALFGQAIASSAFNAKEKSDWVQESLARWQHCLRLAILSFCQILVAVNSSFKKGYRADPRPSPHLLTAKVRRLTCWARQCSAWLTLRLPLLTGGISNSSLESSLLTLWADYRTMLGTLAQNFPLSTLPELDYLLPEDESTLGFQPVANLKNERHRARYCMGDSDVPKPSSNHKEVKRLPSLQETLARLRDILYDGRWFLLQNESPLKTGIDDDFLETWIATTIDETQSELSGDTTHVSETKFLSSRESGSDQNGELSTPQDQREVPLNIVAVPNGNTRKGQRPQDGTRNVPLPVPSSQSMLPPPVPSPIAIPSTCGSIPSPTPHTQPSQRKRKLDFSDDFSTPPDFCGSNQSLPQPDQTPPPGQDQ